MYSNTHPLPPCRLAEKTEQYDAIKEQLHHNERLLTEMQDERSKASREGSSRLANLNQALMKVHTVYEIITPPVFLLHSFLLSIHIHTCSFTLSGFLTVGKAECSAAVRGDSDSEVTRTRTGGKV